ncbi:MAG: DUF2207 domain-containing protein [Clostridiales bacterium]|nr:DUF2207 domain-containing protein [Clostridiales bacterium]
MKKEKMKRCGGLVAAGLLLGLVTYASVYPVISPKAEENEKVTVISTQTSGEGVIDVSDYTVSINVNEDCTVDVAEKVTVEFVSAEADSFYRTISHSPESILSLKVTCENNADLRYTLVDEDDCAKIECFGGVAVGNVWTYEINYTVALNENELTEEFVFNIVNEGWQNTVENVVAKITLPDSIINYDVYNGEGEKVSNVSTVLSEDGKTITVSSKNSGAVATSTNAIMVKIYLPDAEIIEDFNQINEQANEIIWTPTMIAALIIGSLLAVVCVMLIT